MEAWKLVFCMILVFANYSNALTTTRKETTTRGNVISETFKQLDLQESEIDPNVGPIFPNAEEVVSNAVEEAVVPNISENLISEAEAENVGPLLPDVISAVNEDDPNELSKYCKCSDTHCDCCRNFALPIIPVRGPACAKITYLGNEKMSISIKYGDIILATRTISGKKAKPICVGLPGGFSKFCGIVYGLSKVKDDFKACLGLELRGNEEVEASLRVSCFKFGAKGLTVSEAEPLPEVPKDGDEDDDIFGFGGDGADDDEYDEDDEDEDEDGEPEDDDDIDADEVPSDDADYGAFSFSGLFDELEDSEEANRTVQGTPTEQKYIAQSKNENGTPTVVKNAISNSDDTTKPSKAKKKKSTESVFAIDILNGIIDFFN